MSDQPRDFLKLLETNCKRKQLRHQKKQMRATCRTAFAQHKKLDEVLAQKNKAIEKRQKKSAKRKRQRQDRRLRANASSTISVDVGMDKQKQQRNVKGMEEEDEEEAGEGFDEDYTLERFKEEAEQMRRSRMATNELDEEDRTIRRVENKLNKGAEKKKRRRRKNQNGSDSSDGEGEEDGGEELMVEGKGRRENNGMRNNADWAGDSRLDLGKIFAYLGDDSCGDDDNDDNQEEADEDGDNDEDGEEEE